MREPSSEGIFRAGTLGYIRFFWPFNHICLENFLVEEVLPSLLIALHLDAMQAFSIALLDLLVFSADLFSWAFREIGLNEAKISAVKLDELYFLFNVPRRTSQNLRCSRRSSRLMKNEEQVGCVVREFCQPMTKEFLTTWCSYYDNNYTE